MKSLVWFRNDLRLHDHEALAVAAQEGDVLPVYVFDERELGRTSFGFPRTGMHRAGFKLESVLDLGHQFQKLGGELLIVKGNPASVLPALVSQYEIDQLLYYQDITEEELRVERDLESLCDCTLKPYWGSTLIHRDDLSFSKDSIPEVFTDFRKAVEKHSEIRPEIESPSHISFIKLEAPVQIPSLEEFGLKDRPGDSRSVLAFRGGESAGLDRLEDYFWREDQLKDYKYTRNGLLGANYSSKLSPWLAHGCISPRRIYWEVKRYEKERTQNQSTYWMIFELLWRDYFRFSAWKYGSAIFHQGGIQKKKREWQTDPELFERWAAGRTGIPFIDANMRELNETGFMSNRGRQNVASFLAQNLNLDWRMGAEYFESLLLDYDPCSNYGNWAYNATVGHDPRNRYFNILGQAERYDKKGEFVRYWLPELKGVPNEFIHKPHTMAKEQQKLFELHIGDDYPEPMIDLEASYENIKARD